MSFLRQTKATLRGLLEAAPDAIVVVDRAGHVALVNAYAEELFGYGADELIGAPVEMLVPAAKRVAHSGRRDQYQREPHRRPMGSGLELSGCRKDGSQFPVEISLSPVDTDEGPLIMAAVRDTTLKASVERALRAANKELEAFTYSVSHDLRAPIRQIDGFAALLKEHVGATIDDKGRHYLSRIQEGAESMGRLVDDLLNLARIGQQDLRPVRVSLDDLVAEVVASFHSDAASRNVVWHVESLPTVICDPGLLKIAFTNLISNALKYTRPCARAEIHVSVRRGEDAATIVVRDNGVGFDLQYADKLFGVFQRLHRTEEFEGQGVGLAIVQRIVHKHGGEIWADSKPGEGATFSFTLPGARDLAEGR